MDGRFRRIRAVHRAFWHLVAFLLISGLVGLLVGALTMPLVAPAGLGAESASDAFQNVPSNFVDPDLTQRNVIEADDGSVIASMWDPDNEGDRVVVPYSQINPVMSQALVAIEDSRFYQDSAIDLRGTLRALVNDSQSGAQLQGGSTLAQQYVKNVLILEAGTNPQLLEAATADTLNRKITELKDAIAVEQELSKQQILERYLNLVFFGEGAYGVQVAAETYFSTSAADLTVTQAALLAAIVNSPSYYDPMNNPKAALARRNIVIKDMAAPSLHYLTPAQAKADEALPLGLNPGQQVNGCLGAGSDAFFCQYVYTTFVNDSAYGATSAQRIALWDQGGLVVKTTLDPQDEKSGQAAVSQHTYSTDRVSSALAMVQPGTGALLGIAQSNPMGTGSGDTYLDLAADPTHDGSQGYQAGSSFKIFVGLAALEDGWDPNSVLSVPSPMNDAGLSIPACPSNGGRPYVLWPASYSPSNDSGTGFSGKIDAAFWDSVNTYFLTLETKTGLCKPAQIAQSMGVTLDNDSDTGSPLLQIASFTLGTNLITPIEMASAYATVAAQGKYCRPYVITSVTGTDGRGYPAQSPDCRQVLDPNIANELTALLQGVLTEPGATAEGLGIDRPAAGKTGTTTESVATWFDGFTPQLATAVWTGFVVPNTLQGDYMGNMSVGGQYYYGQIFGATISAPIWQQAMEGALDGQPVDQFTTPTGYPSEPGS
ncbi:MAG TPA: transglycosylase domain-containing protein [Actinocrinis sp.]